jgi:hypothetical protein
MVILLDCGRDIELIGYSYFAGAVIGPRVKSDYRGHALESQTWRVNRKGALSKESPLLYDEGSLFD